MWTLEPVLIGNGSQVVRKPFPKIGTRSIYVAQVQYRNTPATPLDQKRMRLQGDMALGRMYSLLAKLSVIFSPFFVQS